MNEDVDEFASTEGFIEGAQQRRQSVTADWQYVTPVIQDVVVREVRNVVGADGGFLTEVFRRDWKTDEVGVDQVFQKVLQPGVASGWHVHRHTTDRIFVNIGTMKVALYDARTDSPTFGQANEFWIGERRPALVVVPPGVWHAVVNVGESLSALLNIVDQAYSYEDPDHWSLPIDTPLIPHRVV